MALSGPPSDAIVLFDGKDLSHWNSVKGGEAKWLVKDGVMTVVPHSGNIATKQEFGDVQLHPSTDSARPRPAVKRSYSS